jgi:hypothetical protein
MGRPCVGGLFTDEGLVAVRPDCRVISNSYMYYAMQVAAVTVTPATQFRIPLCVLSDTTVVSPTRVANTASRSHSCNTRPERRHPFHARACAQSTMPRLTLRIATLLVSATLNGFRKRTREFQPRPFCFGIFLPATRSRIARRNFSRSAGLSASSLRFIAPAMV